MKKFVFFTITAFLFVTILSFTPGPAMAGKEKPVLLKVPIAFPTKLPGLGSTIKWVSERIGTASGGSVKMKV